MTTSLASLCSSRADKVNSTSFGLSSTSSILFNSAILKFFLLKSVCQTFTGYFTPYYYKQSKFLTLCRESTTRFWQGKVDCCSVIDNSFSPCFSAMSIDDAPYTCQPDTSSFKFGWQVYGA